MSNKKKIIILLGVFALIGLLVSFKIQTTKKNKAIELANPPLTNEKISDNPYISQLTKREFDIYQLVLGKIRNLEDGVIEFPYEISGIEFIRVKNCIEVFTEDTSIAFLYYPLTKDNFTSGGITSDEIDCKNEPVYDKCILFLYSSSFTPKDANISPDNRITNLSEFSAGNVDEKQIRNVLEMESKGRELLDQVIDNIPQGSGQRDTLYYFIDWIDNNLKYDRESIDILENKGEDIFENPDDFFQYYMFPSSLSSILDKKALCLGYAKALVYLCNRVGIEASIIIGDVKQSVSYIGHALNKVTIDGKDAYFDVSAVWDYREGNSKAMNLETIKSFIKPVDYFEY